MLFHGISRYFVPILKYSFCAISPRELSVCAIFYFFYNDVSACSCKCTFVTQSVFHLYCLCEHVQVLCSSGQWGEAW